jgi:hypothetical protein
MTYEQIFRGQTLLARAMRHLSNRASRVINGKLGCPARDEGDAVHLMNGLLARLGDEFKDRKLADARRKRRERAV